MCEAFTLLRKCFHGWVLFVKDSFRQANEKSLVTAEKTIVDNYSQVVFSANDPVQFRDQETASLIWSTPKCRGKVLDQALGPRSRHRETIMERGETLVDSASGDSFRFYAALLRWHELARDRLDVIRLVFQLFI
jgi:hypothetical protein